MDLGVLEGQTRGDYFLNSIFDHSVNQCSEQPIPHRRDILGSYTAGFNKTTASSASEFLTEMTPGPWLRNITQTRQIWVPRRILQRPTPLNITEN